MSNATESKSIEADSDNKEKGLFPIDGKWFKFTFYIFTLGLGIFWFVTALDFESFEDKSMPMLAAGSMILLSVIQIVRIHAPQVINKLTPGEGDEELGGMQARLKEAQSGSETDRSLREQHQFELYMIGWVLLLPLMMYYIGFVPSLPVWVFAFTWFFRNLRDAVIVTVLFTLFVFVLFFNLLGLRPWPGVWFPEAVQELTSLIPGL